MIEISWTRADGTLAAIELDATVREQHGSSTVVSKHPVEAGADVTDHVRPEQDTLTLEAVISNQPLSTPATHMGGAVGAVAPINLPMHEVSALTRRRDVGGAKNNAGLERPAGPPKTTANVMQWSASFDHARLVYDELRGLSLRGDVVSVLTPLREYDNLVLTSVEVTREASTGDSLPVSLSFTRIRRVSVQTVDVPRALEERGRRTRNLGNQPAVPVPPAQAERIRSVAVALYETDPVIRNSGILRR
jgi:hypothetical protein